MKALSLSRIRKNPAFAFLWQSYAVPSGHFVVV